jgi:hypothetical protein
MFQKLRTKKKENILAAVITTISLTATLALLAYTYYQNWTPFRQVRAQTINAGQGLQVSAVTKVPVKTKLEYGTSTIYLNSVEATHEAKKEHSLTVSGVLPNKKHYVRLVAYTEGGKQYTSDFYVVE